ncbi:kinase-like protein [Eremomyces bilateralis CBS 781.70]|uniref:Autophagy-related protein 1 n=1 Tax=Eremomyces bilateralis CBS 781.70 TaxID=1392243 RepID=A0A6G1FY04_9PEZI|nr:kinase-like protein [Eremomyces bilateralis CBS 781.70]KAF1810638.1 kinase-like protein [Eremomyces bilateralis CBS 781.70]
MEIIPSNSLSYCLVWLGFDCQRSIDAMQDIVKPILCKEQPASTLKLQRGTYASHERCTHPLVEWPRPPISIMNNITYMSPPVPPLRPWNMGQRRTAENLRSFRSDRKVGSGGFGEVWTYIENRPKRNEENVIAVKFVKFSRAARQEAKALRHANKINRRDEERHALVLEFFGHCTHQPHPDTRNPPSSVIVTEYCNLGSCADWLDVQCRSKGLAIPEFELMFFVYHVTSALAWLHEGDRGDHGRETEWKPMVHCDIKPGNILIRRDSRSPLGKSFVLADFGLATFLAEGESTVRSGGTDRYMAPEMVDYAENGSRTIRNSLLSDVWAVGACLQELARRETPYRTNHLTDEQLADRTQIRRHADRVGGILRLDQDPIGNGQPLDPSQPNIDVWFRRYGCRLFAYSNRLEIVKNLCLQPNVVLRGSARNVRDFAGRVVKGSQAHYLKAKEMGDDYWTVAEFSWTMKKAWWVHAYAHKRKPWTKADGSFSSESMTFLNYLRREVHQRQFCIDMRPIDFDNLRSQFSNDEHQGVPLRDPIAEKALLARAQELFNELVPMIKNGTDNDKNTRWMEIMLELCTTTFPIVDWIETTHDENGNPR